jgi:hypothetical protein
MSRNYNPGKIVYQSNLPKWQTTVDGFCLKLDIVPLKPDFAIASFVVMEQAQPFLNHMGKALAEAVCKKIPPEKELFLITAESKGSHFAPWVWKNLMDLRDTVCSRIISLRKGPPKVYMRRQAVLRGKKINSPKVSFSSITSSEKQALIISPKDIELLASAKRNAQVVFIDDFIGSGGTLIAVKKLFSKLNLSPPKKAAVIGSDGDLYKKSFIQGDFKITLLPQPFPLKLPTFTRETKAAQWRTS